MKSRFCVSVAAAAIGVAVLLTGSLLAQDPMLEASGGFVISQAYGGGGGSTGTYIKDYVELKNVSGSPRSLGGLSLYYGSSTGQFASLATNAFALPNVTVPPGGYFLVELSPAGTGGVALPVPADASTTNLNMSGTSGKVALVAGLRTNACGATATPCPLPHPYIIDLVAWGLSNNAEGGAATNGGAAITSTQGNVRKNGGCQDTDNNNNDFDIITAPVPRNSSSPATACGILKNTSIPLDMNGDGRTDYVVLRDSNGPFTAGGFIHWYVMINSNFSWYRSEWGRIEEDNPAPADYDGDGKTDLAVWRIGSPLSTFYYVESSTGIFRVDQLGFGTDEIVPGDYNGDGKADTAVMRSNGNGTSSWYYRPSPSSNMVLIIHNGDGEKAIGDYDGDGKNDPATFANGGGGVGQFKVTLSGGGTMTENFGTSNDTVVTGDYDGDGKTDFAVLRPDGPLLRWDYDPSSEPGITVVSDTWGLVESDLPVPGDYTGDGKWDYAVWREASQGEFFIMTPITRSIFRKPWGLGGDTPAAFVLVPNYL